MRNLIVVDNPQRWALHVPGVPVVAARAYLSEGRYSDLRGAKVFNLCRSYRYQSVGYYVSLLALARGHKPLPSIMTIQDMKAAAIARVVAEDLGPLIERSLRPLTAKAFTLSIYFGRNLARRYDELSARLFRLFQAPLLRAEFTREKGQWRLRSVGPIAANDIPGWHHKFVVEAAASFFDRKHPASPRRARTQFDLAVLVDPDEKLPPSNRGALRKFASAARRQGLAVETIDRSDYNRLAEFDALFIRETTYVNHHTYRFARRAKAEGLVVIDDPDCIVKCTNKVYLAELLTRCRVRVPRTLIVHRDNRDDVAAQIGFPCILKRPDSSFSQGVLKAENEDELARIVDDMLERSDLIIAQEFVPTAFDWRIGVLDGRPLYACKYFMAKAHWQILKADAGGMLEGDDEPVSLEEVPAAVLRTAVRATRPIGDGLYGVDLKQVGRSVLVMEVNDNPNLDAGVEDRLLGNALYDRIAETFMERILRIKGR